MFDTGMLEGSRVQSTVGCFPELCLLQFSVAQVLVGLRKQYINNFIFPTKACAAGYNNNKLCSEGADGTKTMVRWLGSEGIDGT